MASTQRVLDLLDTPIAIASGERALPTHQIQGEIRFEGVSFGYALRGQILQNLSLTIPAGKTIAIVGSTGSGKSTLVKLLLRLYEIQAGTIYLDGIDIREIYLGDLRRSMGLVSQDVFLFHGTVRENIAYGSPDATETEILRAAQIAEANEFILQLPDGYETIIGERGQKLSGGQRQRLSIARAILKNPPILILDEATSAVDNETEAAIVRSLEKITQNRTTIAIAHRLSTIQRADQIAVLNKGQVIELGNHSELLAKKGAYHNLYTLQFTKQKFEKRKQLIEAQNRFSHEVRTQLNSLIGSLQLLSEEMIDLPEEENELLEISFTSAVDLIGAIEKYERKVLPEE
jgi:ATP-binding cassette subfamily B protein